MKGLNTQKGYALVARSPRHVALPTLSRLARAAIAQVQRWAELHRQRQALAQMGDSTLKDLGLSRADIDQESLRPFWDDPLKK